MNTLLEKHCQVYPAGQPALAPAVSKDLLTQVDGWDLDSDNKSISRLFRFGNFHQTMAFVNALAWIAHGEDHHPDLEVGYNRCYVRYATHSVGGLSENDFICAAKIDRLVAS